jgi:superfamily II DNA or RNA helicase
VEPQFNNLPLLKKIDFIKGDTLEDACIKLRSIKNVLQPCNINPCMIIRIARNKINLSITKLLEKYNYKYAEYYTDTKTESIDVLCEDDNKYDVIFQFEAIKEGVDIRRAYVFYAYEEFSNDTTITQFRGRIARNPLFINKTLYTYEKKVREAALQGYFYVCEDQDESMYDTNHYLQPYHFNYDTKIECEVLWSDEDRCYYFRGENNVRISSPVNFPPSAKKCLVKVDNFNGADGEMYLNYFRIFYVPSRYGAKQVEFNTTTIDTDFEKRIHNYKNQNKSYEEITAK